MKNLLFILAISLSSVSFAQESESKKFYFGGYISPEVTKEVSPYASGKLAFSAGIFVTKFLTKSFELNTGLSYSFVNSEFRNISIGGDEGPTFGPWPNARLTKSDRYIDLPLRINYHLIKKSWALAFRLLFRQKEQ